MVDVDIIEINEEQAQGAKLLASSLSEPTIRKRGMIDMLGISCAVNYLCSNNFRIDTKKSVYKIPLLFEEFKITDIYYRNYRIDVITLYKEKNIKIPKIHNDMDILPNFYFVVQIGAKIQEAKIIGFIDAKNIPACSHDSRYYYPTLDMIIDINKFSTMTLHSAPSKTLLGKHVDCISLFLKFMDGDLSSVYKRQMIQHLMNCDSCRARFIDTAEFERLAGNVRYYPELMRKHSSKANVENVEIKPFEKGKFGSIEEEAEEKTVEKSNVAVLEKDNVPQSGESIDDFDSNSKISDNIQKPIEIFDFSDKEKNQSSKRIIDTIFSGIPKLELPQIKTIANVKNRRVILISTIILFILGSFALISFKGTTLENNENLEAFEEPFEDDYDGEDYSFGGGVDSVNLTENKLDDFAAVQKTIAQPAYSPSVAKVSWEAPESIAEKDSYKKYLQLAGKNIKLNLQNDLLLVSDIPINKVVKLDIRVSSDGDVESVKLVSSSGSNQIDASVRRVIKETLNYMKPPSHGIISKPIDITLVAELN